MQCIRKKAVKLSHYHDKTQQKQPSVNTPRFPSLELNMGDLTKIGSATKYENKTEVQPKYLWFSFQKSKSNTQDVSTIRKNVKRQDLKLKDHVSVDQCQQNRSIDSAQNKSVHSFNSLKERLASRSAQKKLTQIKKIIKNRNANSLSNLLTTQFDSPPTRKSLQNNKKNKKIQIINGNSAIKIAKTTKKIFSDQNQFQQRSAVKQIIPKTFHPDQPKSNKIQDSSKLAKHIQSNNTVVFSDRGKSFKSLLHKTKPVLQLKGRLLTNSKIQTFTQHYDDFHQYS